MIGITKKQEEMLQAIIGYMVIRGYAPTTREIGAMVGLKSTSTVNHHLNCLKEQGLIETDEDTEGFPRALRLPGYKLVKMES